MALDITKVAYGPISVQLDKVKSYQSADCEAYWTKMACGGGEIYFGIDLSHSNGRSISDDERFIARNFLGLHEWEAEGYDCSVESEFGVRVYGHMLVAKYKDENRDEYKVVYVTAYPKKAYLFVNDKQVYVSDAEDW